MRSVDLHGYTIIEAKAILDQSIKYFPKNLHELTVVHGYSTRVLLNFVRKQYRHQRIEKKMVTMNPGETILVLK